VQQKKESLYIFFNFLSNSLAFHYEVLQIY